jgi:hypothetical protein
VQFTTNGGLFRHRSGIGCEMMGFLMPRFVISYRNLDKQVVLNEIQEVRVMSQDELAGGLRKWKRSVFAMEKSDSFRWRSALSLW